MSEAVLERIERKLDGLTEDVGGLKTSVATLTEDIDGLKTSVGTLTQDVGGLKTSVETLTDDVRGLKASVGTLTQDVGSLKTGQAVLRRDVEELQAGQVVRFSGLESRFDRLETKVSDMDARLGVGLEYTRDQVKLLAEGHGGIIQQMDRRFDEQRTAIREIVAPLELALGDHTRALARVLGTPIPGPTVSRRRRVRRKRSG